MTIFSSYRALNRFRKLSVIQRTAHGVCLLVRLQLYRISRVKVSAGVLWHSVTKSNCVAARRGGKQLEVND